MSNYTGYLPPSILWHLLEEGTASMEDLARLIGCERKHLYKPIQRMRVLGQVQYPPSTPGAPQRVLYGLTAQGAHAATLVKRHQVEFAAPQREEVAT